MSLNIHNTTLCVNLIFTKFTVVSRFLVTPLTSDTNRLRASKASILAVDEVPTGVEMFRQVWRCSETCGDVQTGVEMFGEVWGCSDRCGDVQRGVEMFRQVW